MGFIMDEVRDCWEIIVSFGIWVMTSGESVRKSKKNVDSE